MSDSNSPDPNNDPADPNLRAVGANSPDNGSSDKGLTPPKSVDETQAVASKLTALSGASLVGHRLGDYQILRKLGRGGMADVYAARHLSLARDVAIKVLRSDFARDQDYVSRFRREARAAAKLNHPNIVQVYDVGSVDETHFIAQELIDGQNLREHLSDQGSLTTDEAIQTLIAVGGALEAAADVGITHRDIKPENIMRSTRGDVKVADFGLARLGVDTDASRADLTQAGLTLGTPRYMSPEQVQGKVVDVRSDLYSLGVSMYHLLAGRPPFEADDPLALAVMHLHETPDPLDRARGASDIPEWLVAVIARLMNKLPTDRYQSPTEMLNAVRSRTSVAADGMQGAIGTSAATIRLQRVSDTARRARRSHWLRWAACLLIPLCFGGAVAAWASQRPTIRVKELLRPEMVPQATTVEEQFLIAVTRDDVKAWEAVSEYFPANSAKNRAYFAKSMLQLARLNASQGRYHDAYAALNRLLADPAVGRKYRLIAWNRRCHVLEEMGGSESRDPRIAEALKDAKHQFETSYNTLKAENPAAIELFERVVPEPERLQVSVGSADTNEN